MARDEKKKKICKDHGFTLIHVDNTYARRYNFLKDILTEFLTRNSTPQIIPSSDTITSRFSSKIELLVV